MSSTVVRPAAVGTHRFSARIDAAYTAGRDYVGAALETMFRRTDVISMDIETFGLGIEARKLKSVSFGLDNWAVVLDPRDPMQYELILQTVERARIIVVHNGGYDVINMHLNGLFPIECITKVVDTIIYSRFASPSDIGGHDLFAAGKEYAGLDPTADNQLPKAFKARGLAAENGWRLFDIDLPIYLQGAAADVIVTARIYPELLKAAYYQTTSDHPFVNHGVTGQEAMDLIEREQIVNRVLLRRACKGFVVDLEYLDRYRAETAEVNHRADKELRELGIEPLDSQSLLRWMDREGLVPEWYPRTKKTKALSGNKKHVEMLKHPVAQLFLEHKQNVKVEKDYLVKCQDLSVCGPDGLYRVFSGTAVLKAATGRAAMSDPPLHQFNAGARNIMCADPGDSLVTIDWSAIEPVLVANLAGEATMYLHYEGGGDVYTGIAEMAGIERKPAKVVLLAQLYGEGIVKLSADLNTTEMSAKELRDNIFGQIPHVEKFIYRMKDMAGRYRKIMTLSGRIIPIPMGKFEDADTGEITWSVQRHKGVNYTVQGGAYDVLAETVVRAERAGIGDGIYWTMHDELICSKEIAHDLQRIMETPPDRLCYLSGRTPKLRTDMDEMGPCWLSEEQIKLRNAA